MGWVQTVARVIHFLILSLWLGAGVFFMAVFAPRAFHVIPSRDLAGELVRASLSWFDLFGLVAGPFLMLTLLLGWLPIKVPLRLRMALVAIMTFAVGLSGRWVTPSMMRLRESMGRPIEAVEAGDPLKVQFGQLHAVSTGLMAVHLAVALVLLVLGIVASSPKKKFGIEL